MTADLRKIRELAGAAGYLCCAHDELVAAGYAEWVAELCDLIDSIAVEIRRLEGREHEAIAPGHPADDGVRRAPASVSQAVPASFWPSASLRDSPPGSTGLTAEA